MAEHKSYPRAALIEIAGLSGAQLDYLVKLGVVAPDIGAQRKRYSQDEAILVVIAGAALRAGVPANRLEEPVEWLREQLKDDSNNGFLENVRMAADTSIELPDEISTGKPLFIHFAFLGDYGWRCAWSNEAQSIDEAEVWYTINFRRLNPLHEVVAT